MTTKRIHVPQTTAQQRQLLFETWEATGNTTAACHKAHVGRGTFYFWKPRFDEYGYAGLGEFASREPKEPHRTPAEIEQKVIVLRQEHSGWGRKRIADKMAKGNNWVPLVSPNTIRRILKDAGLWTTEEPGEGKTERHISHSDGGALRFLLPPRLLFLISDRGTHFTANAFQALALSEAFIHVLIARHRPQSKRGIFCLPV